MSLTFDLYNFGSLTLFARICAPFLYICIYIHARALSKSHAIHGTRVIISAPVRKVTLCISIIYRHLLPNSARTSYATERALDFISAQLSTDAVTALGKAWVLV